MYGLGAEMDPAHTAPARDRRRLLAALPMWKSVVGDEAYARARSTADARRSRTTWSVERLRDPGQPAVALNFRYPAGMSRSSVLVALVVACAACNALVGYDNSRRSRRTRADRAAAVVVATAAAAVAAVTMTTTMTTSDAGGTTLSSGGADASVTGRCDPAKLFGTPVRVDAF